MSGTTNNTRTSRRPKSRRWLRTLAVIAVMALALSAASTMPAAARQDLSTGTISESGVGNAVLGSTVDQLQAQLGDNWSFVPVDQFIVDFGGWAVREFGETRFHALTDGSTDRLTLFIVDRPGFTTTAGIGPGSTIDDGVAAYGEATLRYNLEDEGREFVRFANGPAGRISFRTGSVGDTAGIYTDTNDTFNETTQYRDGAAIESIWVSCAVGIDCPTAPALAYTGPPATSVNLAIFGVSLVLSGIALVGAARRRIERAWVR